MCILRSLWFGQTFVYIISRLFSLNKSPRPRRQCDQMARLFISIFGHYQRRKCLKRINMLLKWVENFAKHQMHLTMLPKSFLTWPKWRNFAKSGPLTRRRRHRPQLPSMLFWCTRAASSLQSNLFVSSKILRTSFLPHSSVFQMSPLRLYCRVPCVGYNLMNRHRHSVPFNYIFLFLDM